MKMKIYPLKMMESMNIDVKVAAAKENMTMQDWMTKAIAEKIGRSDKELLRLLNRAYRFVEGGPSPELEKDLKKYCTLLSNN